MLPGPGLLAVNTVAYGGMISWSFSLAATLQRFDIFGLAKDRKNISRIGNAEFQKKLWICSFFEV